jgi:hypothetical protein
MKKINSIPLITMSVWMLLFTFAGCKKEDNPTPSYGSILLHLHTYVGDTEVENYGDLLELTGGRKITVNTAQLYLSNIQLIKTDGSVIDGPDTIVFLRQGIEEYEIGSVLAGNYKSIRFDVGVSDSTNMATPAISDPNLYQPSMWFGASAQPEGFVFINFQGAIDTTAAADGADLIPFAYKIGTSANRVTVTMPDQNHTIVPDQQDVYHILANYAGLLDGIQLNNADNLQLTSAAQNSSLLASQLVANIAGMFDYEQ